MLLASASRSVHNAAISAGVGKAYQATKGATAAAIAVTPSPECHACIGRPLQGLQGRDRTLSFSSYGFRGAWSARPGSRERRIRVFTGGEPCRTGASPARFERATPALGGRCSIQLSYGDVPTSLKHYCARPELNARCQVIVSEAFAQLARHLRTRHRTRPFGM